jgi:hypothetical protein
VVHDVEVVCEDRRNINYDYPKLDVADDNLEVLCEKCNSNHELLKPSVADDSKD